MRDLLTVQRGSLDDQEAEATRSQANATHSQAHATRSEAKFCITAEGGAPAVTYCITILSGLRLHTAV